MRASRLLAASVLAALAFAPAARAAVDAFIWFENIKGESQDSKHPGWIEVESFQLQDANRQASAASAAGGRLEGKVNLSEFSVKKVVDKASPALFNACATGKHFPNVVIEMRKAGGTQQEYLKITLQNVLISSYQVSGRGGAPTETISMSFGAVKWEYTPQTKGNTGAAAVALAPGALKVAPTPTPRGGVVRVPVVR